MRWRLVLAGLAVLTAFSVLAPTLQAAAPTDTEMARQIDARLSEVWAKEQVSPAPAASDAEFLRRAWLDLCGILPPINADDGITGIRDFLSSTSPDKHAELIDELLKKPTHATHFANLWKNVMLPEADNLRRFGGAFGFESWLRTEFAENTPYDEMVSELLLATGAANQQGPALFYTSLDLKAEELAASTSRLFLGTQIQCAQCHDHPFDHWKQADFWGYAAFFARLQRPTNPQQRAFQVTDAPTGEVTLPETEDVVAPRFLGEKNVSSDSNTPSRRERLAKWLTSPENPYFAKATVNRVWAVMFGRGIVDPVDDLGEHNPATHPELLQELADYFVDTGFDLKRLVRTLALTEAYRRSSRLAPGEEDQPWLYARMQVKTLTAEQLYDCLAEAMRRRDNVRTQGRFANSRTLDQNRQAFLTKFRAPTQGATEYQAGIPQALTLMNGSLVQEATDLARSDLLVSLDAPFFTNIQRLEILFLSTLSRPPGEIEQKKFLEYIEQGGTTGNPRDALGDVLWALLNSAEFILNH